MIIPKVYIGYDPREVDACKVTRYSLLRHATSLLPVRLLVLAELQRAGYYTRPTVFPKLGRVVDLLSRRDDYDGSMSTQHAISRFFVPIIAREGWAIFMDGDMLVRDDIFKVLKKLDKDKAVYVVQHKYEPDATSKMDGQLQTKYFRKNWSSFMIWNCDHPANKVLREIVNKWPGRDLHGFLWLNDKYIGELHPKWNYLVGHTKLKKPSIVHFTEGLPNMPGYENCEYANEWRQELRKIENGQPANKEFAPAK